MADSRLPNIANLWVVCVVVVVIGTVAFMFRATRTVADAHPPSDQFVGPARCRECHQEQYESWSKTRMARTFEVLKAGVLVAEKRIADLDPERDYTRDEVCLGCHTTGHGLRGGFVSIEETPDMAGVTCEACHGPGGMYVSTVMGGSDKAFATTEAVEKGLVYPPTEKVCKKCHNDGSPFVGMDYTFDFDERVARGTHEHHRLKYQHSPNMAPGTSTPQAPAASPDGSAADSAADSREEKSDG
jgi:hypothetical protein